MLKFKEETEILNEFVIELLALLEQQKSKTQINAQIKELEKSIRKLMLVGILADGREPPADKDTGEDGQPPVEQGN